VTYTLLLYGFILQHQKTQLNTISRGESISSRTQIQEVKVTQF